ncbi:MAG: hypothetical protein ACLP9C_08255 [Acidimicrobiales bacterium]
MDSARLATALSIRASRRAPALIALAVTLVLGMNYTLWWPEAVHHVSGIWATPSDQWGTYLASVNLVHLHFTQLYTGRSGLETFPGILFLLAPMTALGSALHLELGPNLAAFAEPTGWVLAGPYELILGSIPIFACDAIAERWGVPRGRRVALALVEAALLANVTIRWGHPEDAVALGLVLYAALEADRGRWTATAWLVGVAICVQPFAVVALAALFARLDWPRLRRLVGPVVVPSALVLAGPLIASWHTTVHTLVDQPNYPGLNHLTPWTSLLPRLPERFLAVPSGPGRLAAVVVASAVGLVVCRSHHRLETVLAVIGVGLLLRLLGESVMDGFYSWPVLAVGVLLASRRGRLRLAAAAAVGVFATWFSDVDWRGVWPWWSILMVSLLVTLAIGWPERARTATAQSPAGPRAASGPDEPTLDESTGGRGLTVGANER